MDISPTEACVALSTTDSEESAREIAHALVAEGLAACVSRIPGASSVYKWQGETCEDREILLVIKTRRTLIPAIEARFEKLHPYSQPELIAMSITAGDRGYLDWLLSGTR